MSPHHPAHPDHAPGEIRFEHRDVTAVRGAYDAHRHRFGLVVARFNALISAELFKGAVDVLLDAGATPQALVAVQVPNAVEASVAARVLAQSNKYAAIVVIGCIIKGETSHFDHVTQSITDACNQVSLQTSIPIGFGIVMADTMEQAQARAGVERNMGADAARFALEMADVLRLVRA